MSAAGPLPQRHEGTQPVHISAFVPDAPASAPVQGDDAGQPPTAAERLAASRERMREWMLQADTRGVARRRVQAAREAGDKPAWIDRLRAVPVVGVVLDAANAWWANHPMQPVAQLAQGVVHDSVAPLARRHPILVVSGAFLIGVAVVRWRPWRWLVKPRALRRTRLADHRACGRIGPDRKHLRGDRLVRAEAAA
jgi:hypothetical protein